MPRPPASKHTETTGGDDIKTRAGKPKNKATPETEGDIKGAKEGGEVSARASKQRNPKAQGAKTSVKPASVKRLPPAPQRNKTRAGMPNTKATSKREIDIEGAKRGGKGNARASKQRNPKAQGAKTSAKPASVKHRPPAPQHNKTRAGKPKTKDTSEMEEDIEETKGGGKMSARDKQHKPEAPGATTSAEHESYKDALTSNMPSDKPSVNTKPSDSASVNSKPSNSDKQCASAKLDAALPGASPKLPGMPNKPSVSTKPSDSAKQCASAKLDAARPGASPKPPWRPNTHIDHATKHAYSRHIEDFITRGPLMDDPEGFEDAWEVAMSEIKRIGERSVEEEQQRREHENMTRTRDAAMRAAGAERQRNTNAIAAADRDARQRIRDFHERKLANIQLTKERVKAEHAERIVRKERQREETARKQLNKARRLEEKQEAQKKRQRRQDDVDTRQAKTQPERKGGPDPERTPAETADPPTPPIAFINTGDGDCAEMSQLTQDTALEKDGPMGTHFSADAITNSDRDGNASNSEVLMAIYGIAPPDAIVQFAEQLDHSVEYNGLIAPKTSARRKRYEDDPSSGDSDSGNGGDSNVSNDTRTTGESSKRMKRWMSRWPGSNKTSPGAESPINPPSDTSVSTSRSSDSVNGDGSSKNNSTNSSAAESLETETPDPNTLGIAEGHTLNVYFVGRRDGVSIMPFQPDTPDNPNETTITPLEWAAGEIYLSDESCFPRSIWKKRPHHPEVAQSNKPLHVLLTRKKKDMIVYFNHVGLRHIAVAPAFDKSDGFIPDVPDDQDLHEFQEDPMYKRDDHGNLPYCNYTSAQGSNFQQSPYWSRYDEGVRYKTTGSSREHVFRVPPDVLSGEAVVIPVFESIPHSQKLAYAQLSADLLGRIADIGANKNDGERYLFTRMAYLLNAFQLLPRIVLRRGTSSRGNGKANVKTVEMRIRLIQEGRWEETITSFMKDVAYWRAKSPPPPPSNDDANRMRQVNRKMGAGRAGEARKACTNGGMANAIDPAVNKQLGTQFVHKTPEHSLPPPPTPEESREITDFTTDTKAVLQVLKGLKTLKAHGTDCHRNEFFSPLQLTHRPNPDSEVRVGTDGVVALAGFIQLFQQTRLPTYWYHLFNTTRILPLFKDPKTNKVRPATVPSRLLCLSQAILSAEHSKDVAELVYPFNTGIVPNGPLRISGGITIHKELNDKKVEEGKVTDGKVIVFGDIQNAYNTISSKMIAKSMKEKLPEAYRFHRLFSSLPKRAVAVRGSHVTELGFSIEEGILQGITFSSETFILCFTEVIEWADKKIKEFEGKDSSSFARAGWDDYTIMCEIETYHKLHPLLIKKLVEYNLKLAPGKSEYYAHADDRSKPKFTTLTTKFNIPPATVPITTIDGEPVYELDDDGETRTDANGAPVQKFDYGAKIFGVPIGEDAAMLELVKAKLNAFLKDNEGVKHLLLDSPAAPGNGMQLLGLITVKCTQWQVEYLQRATPPGILDQVDFAKRVDDAIKTNIALSMGIVPDDLIAACDDKGLPSDNAYKHDAIMSQFADRLNMRLSCGGYGVRSAQDLQNIRFIAGKIATLEEMNSHSVLKGHEDAPEYAYTKGSFDDPDMKAALGEDAFGEAGKALRRLTTFFNTDIPLAKHLNKAIVDARAQHNKLNPGVLERAPLHPTTGEVDLERFQDPHVCKLLDTHNTNAAHVAQYIPGYFDVHTNDFGLPFSNMTSAKDNLLERPPDNTTGNNTNETQTPTNDPFHRPSDPIPTQLQHELTKCSDGDRYVKFSQHIALTSTVDPNSGITLDPKSAAAYLYSAHANQNM
ncbi:hypothetical protein TeGR_g4581, partial [Tetraparma gracilis]